MPPNDINSYGFVSPMAPDLVNPYGFGNDDFAHAGVFRSLSISAELSHSLKVSDLRRNTPKSAQTRSESLCAGLWVPCRIFLAWLRPAWGGPDLGPKSRIFGRILEHVPGPCSLGRAGGQEKAFQGAKKSLRWGTKRVHQDGGWRQEVASRGGVKS
jgi:hypothetical protein